MPNFFAKSSTESTTVALRAYGAVVPPGSPRITARIKPGDVVVLKQPKRSLRGVQ